MVFKGLLVLLSGFLFIFSSGIPMRLISRYKPDYRREVLFWGVGIWIIAFLVSTFLQNLIRQIVAGGVQPAAQQSPLTYLLGAVITTLLVQAGMLIYLNQRRKKDSDLTGEGLALGFGIGVIAQIFTGMILIAAGIGVVFQGIGLNLNLGQIQASTIDVISGESFLELFFALLSLVFFRIALLTVTATQGYLVAKSIIDRRIWFWAALLIYTAFIWLIFFLQMLLGDPNAGQVSLGLTTLLSSVVSAVYYFGVFFLGTRWLSVQLQSEMKMKSKKRSK
ncbi:MAG: hypothetical protein FJZ98_10380 [Chloroflexi bacterium]|nr:hypothetical protein [Chloroflexota bacterium]